VSFFDVTPVGRILNRFSSDVFSIDDTLPFILNIFLAQAFSLLGVVVVCCYGLPYIVLLIAPLSVIYYFIQVSVLCAFIDILSYVILFHVGSVAVERATVFVGRIFQVATVPGYNLVLLV